MERGEVEEEEEEKEERKSGSSYTSLVSGCSSRSSVCLAPPTWTRLVPLRTQYETSRFLQAISLKFWKVVDIEDPGMLEDLMAAGVVTADDAESLAGIHLPTRKDKTRRLWSILNNIHHRRFSKKVLPILCKYYWHIIPENFWLPGNASPIPDTRSSPREDGSESSGGSPYCLRCAIQSRIRPTDVGDILAAAGLITPKIHRDIVSRYRNCSTDWSKLFRAFKKLAGHDSSSHVTKMRRLIARHSLRVPGHLPRLLVEGFPCTCPSRRKSGLCLPPMGCLSPSSSNESGLPSIHSLSASGDNEGFECSSTLSLPSASSQSEESSSSDNRQLSDYHETVLKEVISISAQNSSPSDRNSEMCPSSGDVLHPSEDKAPGKEAEGSQVEERERGTNCGSLLTYEGQPSRQCSEEDEETLLKHVHEGPLFYQTDETIPKTLAQRSQGRGYPARSTSELTNQRSATDTQIKTSGSTVSNEETRTSTRRASVSKDEFQLTPVDLPFAQSTSATFVQNDIPSKLLNLCSQSTQTTVGTDTNASETQSVGAASHRAWTGQARSFDTRHTSCETLLHSSTLSVPSSTVTVPCMGDRYDKRKRIRNYTKWELRFAQYSTCGKSLLVFGACLFGILLLAVVLSPLALLAVGMETDNYRFAIAGCAVHAILVVSFFCATRKKKHW